MSNNFISRYLMSVSEMVGTTAPKKIITAFWVPLLPTHAKSTKSKCLQAPTVGVSKREPRCSQTKQQKLCNELHKHWNKSITILYGVPKKSQ